MNRAKKRMPIKNNMPPIIVVRNLGSLCIYVDVESF